MMPRNCSRGWQADVSGDGELAIDEGADCVPVRLSLQARGAGDGSISGVDLGAPAAYSDEAAPGFRDDCAP